MNRFWFSSCVNGVLIQWLFCVLKGSSSVQSWYADSYVGGLNLPQSLCTSGVKMTMHQYLTIVNREHHYESSILGNKAFECLTNLMLRQSTKRHFSTPRCTRAWWFISIYLLWNGSHGKPKACYSVELSRLNFTNKYHCHVAKVF